MARRHLALGGLLVLVAAGAVALALRDPKPAHDAARAAAREPPGEAAARPTAPPVDVTRGAGRAPDPPVVPPPAVRGADARASTQVPASPDVPRSDAPGLTRRPATRAEVGPPPASRQEAHVDGEIADVATAPRPSTAELHRAGALVAGRVVPLTRQDPGRPVDLTRADATRPGPLPSADETRAAPRPVPTWPGPGTDTTR